ncbi:MAG: prolyl-tRNA synthetase [Candidatus Wildermuthbacteria bacterium]|nr:prolyl-tRNA synthetase [Candidatus Wildermuthbacteria bacterium]
MRQSQLFTKTQKTLPKGEESKNAQLLIQAGFIHKEMAGVYSYLPLGLRVLKNIEQIIREEMNAIGGQELLLTGLQNPEIWQTSGRWADEAVDIWFKTKLKNDTEIGLSWTHEEPLTALMRNHISSYRDLPVYVYQMQTKFRNELRAKSGIMRTREFIMKDLYSFCKNEEEHKAFYEKAKQAYIKIFDHVGLGHVTYVTMASGGSFAKYSHEFQTLTEAGEDIIYIDEQTKEAVNEEIIDDKDLGYDKNKLRKEKAVEVGNIFTLGTKYSEVLGLQYQDDQGNKRPVFMGSYGIGPARVMGTIAELFADEKGLVWPSSVAPFLTHLLCLSDSTEEADALYEQLQSVGIEVLYDDRHGMSAGEKFADADLIGIPWRLVISDKTLASKSVEVKARQSKEIKLVSLRELPSYLHSKIS